MNFVEVKIHRSRAMASHRVPHHVIGHKRIAVPVAADPASQFEKIGESYFAEIPMQQQIFHLGVKLRQLMEKGVPVIRESILDLVVYRKPQLAQDSRLPKREHHA